jgi:hypothetical protein
MDPILGLHFTIAKPANKIWWNQLTVWLITIRNSVKLYKLNRRQNVYKMCFANEKFQIETLRNYEIFYGAAKKR